MKYRVVDANKAELPITRLCDMLGVSASGYYSWKNRKMSNRQRDDVIYLAHIRASFAESNESYGVRRIHADMQEKGLAVGRERTARLMRDNKLKPRRTKRFKRTTDSNHKHPIAENILEQDFSCQAPDEKWGVDISYIWTAEGWLYLAIVLDLFSRRIVGWAANKRMQKGLAMEALQRAIALRRPLPGLIHHSDRGSQYCSGDYQKLLQAHNIKPSMSGKGNCYDNSMVETVFKTIKSELVWRTSFMTRLEAKAAIGQYIDGFYNPRRRHSALGYKSPLAFEREMAVM
jgi:putative transposase